MAQARIDFEQFLLFLRQRLGVGRAIGGKDNPLSVGRIGSLGIVAARVAQSRGFIGFDIVDHQFISFVVIPSVSFRLTRFAEFDFGFLFCLGIGIKLRRSEQYALVVGMDPGTSRLANPGETRCVSPVSRSIK